MQHTVSLCRKLLSIGAGLLLVALVSIGLTLWVTWQFEGGAAAVNEAGRMRMQAWRITSVVQTGVNEAELQTLVAQFDKSLTLLRSGDASRPLFVPWDEQLRVKFAIVESLWLGQRQQWLEQPALQMAPSVQTTSAFVEAIDQFVLAIEKHLSRLTAILNLFQLTMMTPMAGMAGMAPWRRLNTQCSAFRLNALSCVSTATAARSGRPTKGLLTKPSR